MVKHIKTIAAVCTAAVLTLVGCSNINNGAIIGDSTETTSLNLSVTNANNIHALIAPDTLKLPEISSYKIEGESLSGTKLELAPITITNGTGKLTEVLVDDWTFTLHAYADAEATTEILRGTSTCMLKTGTNVTSVSFVLSSYNVSTTGGYEITIGYYGGAWDSSYTFKYGVYNSTTGQPVGSEVSITTDTSDIVCTKSGDTVTGGKTVTGTGLAAGSYIFGVYIYKGGAQLAYVSDVLVIEPGRTTTGKLVFGNVISTLPAAPSTFIAQELLNTAYKPSGDFYNVRLYWKDQATNEESYELIVREFTNTSDAWASYAENADDTTLLAAYGTRYDFADILTLTTSNNKFNIGWKDGSLYAGSEELILTVPTGRMFDFQIRAKNQIGTSASIVRVKDETSELAYLAGTASATQTKISAIQGDCTGYDINDGADPVTFYKHVNLVQTKYSLDGGELKTSSADTFAGDVYVTYDIYKLKYEAYTTATSPNLDAYDSTYLKLLTTPNGWYSLKKENADWTGWNTDIGRVSTKVTHNINGYKNITVVAQYGESEIDELGVSVTKIEELPKLDDDNITCFYGDKQAAVNAADCKNGTITIARGSAAQYVTVTVASASDDIFKKYELYVNGRLIDSQNSGDSFSFANFSTNKLKSGVANTIMVVGTTAAGRKASSSFTITLTN